MAVRSFFCCFLLICSLAFPGSGMANDVKKLCIVASYEEGHICGGPQEKGILKGLSRQGYIEGSNLTVERYYMDTKEKHTTAEQMQQEGVKALKKIQDFSPDVVVTIDDNAFREVGLLPENKGLNIAHEAVDRHAEGSRAGHLAIRWVGKNGTLKDFTYGDLKGETNRFANVLKRIGLGPANGFFSWQDGFRNFISRPWAP